MDFGTLTSKGELNEKGSQVNERLSDIVDDSSNLRFICNKNIFFILIMKGCISTKGEMEPLH